MTRRDLPVGAGPHATTRRKFLQGLAVGSILTGVGPWSPLRAVAANGTAAGLRGNEFDLSVGETAVNLTGRASTATVLNGVLPGPLLRWREGDTVTLRVHNDLTVDTSIHWHGIVLPAEHGRRTGTQFPRHPAGRIVHVPLRRSAARHLLVSRTLRVSSSKPV